MTMGGLIWIIIVGFVAGIIARFLSPGPNNPSGFLLTTGLGIVGAFLATAIGQAIGHYGPNQGAGFIMATGLLTLAVITAQVASTFVSQGDGRDTPAPRDEAASREITLAELDERLARIEQLLIASLPGGSPGGTGSH